MRRGERCFVADGNFCGINLVHVTTAICVCPTKLTAGEGTVSPTTDRHGGHGAVNRSADIVVCEIPSAVWIDNCCCWTLNWLDCTSSGSAPAKSVARLELFWFNVSWVLAMSSCPMQSC